jgi:hypothetical protein
MQTFIKVNILMIIHFKPFFAKEKPNFSNLAFLGKNLFTGMKNFYSIFVENQFLILF